MIILAFGDVHSNFKVVKRLVNRAKKADILIVAAGKPGLIKAMHVKKGAVVIDVGITRATQELLVGDVDFDEVKNIAGFISPVPGGKSKKSKSRSPQYASLNNCSKTLCSIGPRKATASDRSGLNISIETTLTP